MSSAGNILRRGGSDSSSFLPWIFVLFLAVCGCVCFSFCLGHPRISRKKEKGSENHSGKEKICHYRSCFNTSSCTRRRLQVKYPFINYKLYIMYHLFSNIFLLIDRSRARGRTLLCAIKPRHCGQQRNNQLSCHPPRNPSGTYALQSLRALVFTAHWTASQRKQETADVQ